MRTFDVVAGAWGWIALTAVVVATAAGLRWALADFVLDRIGPSPTEWGDRFR